MAFNVRSGGEHVVVPVGKAVKSGDAVRVGLLFGIAERDAALGGDGLYYTTIARQGIAHVPASNLVFAVGDAVYATTPTASGDNQGKTTLAKTSATGSVLVGVATTPKSATQTDVWFVIDPNGVVGA